MRDGQDTSFHDRFLAEKLADPELRAEFERERGEIEAVDALVGALADLATLRERLPAIDGAALAREARAELERRGS